MSTLSLRLPESLHDMARQLAREEKISINQFVTVALAEKISALATEQYFAARSKRGSRTKFERALSKVGKVEPADFDRLPSKKSK